MPTRRIRQPPQFHSQMEFIAVVGQAPNHTGKTSVCQREGDSHRPYKYRRSGNEAFNWEEALIFLFIKATCLLHAV